MQKMAGLITESQYKEKVKALNESKFGDVIKNIFSKTHKAAAERAKASAAQAEQEAKKQADSKEELAKIEGKFNELAQDTKFLNLLDQFVKQSDDFYADLVKDYQAGNPGSSDAEALTYISDTNYGDEANKILKDLIKYLDEKYKDELGFDSSKLMSSFGKQLKNSYKNIKK